MLAALRVCMSGAIACGFVRSIGDWVCDRRCPGACGLIRTTCGLDRIPEDGPVLDPRPDPVGIGSGAVPGRIDITCHIFCLTECMWHVVAFHPRQC